jgi:hypothetical protein
MSPVVLGTKNHCADEGQQQYSSEVVNSCEHDTETLDPTKVGNYSTC